MSENPQGGRLPRRVLIRRGAVALALIIALGAAKLGVSHGIIKVRTLTPPSRAVAASLLIGAAPTDADLRQLAAFFHVDGVINLSAPSIAEQVTAASLHQGYLYLPLARDASPTWAQLRDMAGFLRRYTAGGATVYLHDDAGAGQAVTAAAMLFLLRGQPWSTVSKELTPAELGSLCDCQRRAVARLRSALHPAGRSRPGNPYAKARLDPW